jgi:hypothetical protein
MINVAQQKLATVEANKATLFSDIPFGSWEGNSIYIISFYFRAIYLLADMKRPITSCRT